jgi:amino acid transporter
MSQELDLIVTLSGIVICAVLAFVGIRLRFREKTDIRPYRMPWMIIALFAIAIAFMLVVHLVNIFGLETGGRR